jgi:hypothetical protein
MKRGSFPVSFLSWLVNLTVGYYLYLSADEPVLRRFVDLGARAQIDSLDQQLPCYPDPPSVRLRVKDTYSTHSALHPSSVWG